MKIEYSYPPNPPTKGGFFSSFFCRFLTATATKIEPRKRILVFKSFAYERFHTSAINQAWDNNIGRISLWGGFIICVTIFVHHKTDVKRRHKRIFNPAFGLKARPKKFGFQDTFFKAVDRLKNAAFRGGFYALCQGQRVAAC